nr:MAG TPA: hypothetical protein [Caudoviricetes sp.]
MFIVLCFPLGNFSWLGLSYFCQPDGFLVTVVCSTELFRIWILMSFRITTKPFIYLLKTSCPQRAPIDDNLTQRLCRTGNYLRRTGCAVTHLS